MHISKKLSTVISMILTVILVGALIYLTLLLPDITDAMIRAEELVGHQSLISETERLWVLIEAYVMVAVAFVAVILLFFLLKAVLCEAIFTKRATRLLGAISWCCFAEGMLFLLLIFRFQLAFGIAVAAFFLGLCLRVVKNVIEEATRIKSENDLTI